MDQGQQEEVIAEKLSNVLAEKLSNVQSSNLSTSDKSDKLTVRSIEDPEIGGIDNLPGKFKMI